MISIGGLSEMFDILRTERSSACVFQFYGEHLFTWINRDGEEKTVTIENSECDRKKPIWAHDVVQIDNKRDLPIKTVKYGKMELELEEMKLEIGPVICQKPEHEIDDVEEKINNRALEIMEKVDQEIEKRESLQKFTNDTLDDLEEAINTIDRNKQGAYAALSLLFIFHFTYFVIENIFFDSSYVSDKSLPV